MIIMFCEKQPEYTIDKERDMTDICRKNLFLCRIGVVEIEIFWRFKI